MVSLYLSHSFTGMLALFLVIFGYCFYKKYYKFLIILGVISTFLFFHIEWQKFLIRPHCWLFSIKEIIRSPIFGHGFDNSLKMNKILVYINPYFQDYTFRHNDYLNIARDLGLPFLGVLIFGIYRILKNVKIDYIFLSLMILIIGCFVQTSFYYPRIAIFGIIFLALKEREKCKISLS